MTLVPVDPIVSETPQADFSCPCPNPVKAVPLGSEDGRLRVHDPQSFANAIEEALRRMQLSGQEQAAQEGKTAPVPPPAQQDISFFLPPSPGAETAEARMKDDSAATSSASIPENAGPQTGSVLNVWTPVELAIAAPEAASTPLLSAPQAPAAPAAQSPETPALSLFPVQNEETRAAVAAAPAEGAVLQLSGSAQEPDGTGIAKSSASQAHLSEAQPSDLSLLPAEGDEHASPDTGNPRLCVPVDEPGAPGNCPSPDRRLTVSFTRTTEPLLKEPTAGPQSSGSAATAAEAAAEGPNRSRPAEGSAPKLPAHAALSQEDPAPGLFPAVAAAGKPSSEASETGERARTSEGRPNEPLLSEEDTPASSDLEQETNGAFQDGRTAHKTCAPRTVSDAGPSARPPFHGRERPLPAADLAGTERTDPLQQAGANPAEGRAEIPGGPGRSAPTPGPWRSDAIASHLQIHARQALENSPKQFHLRIQGEGLGSMRWDVRLEPGKIAAQALVDTPKLQEMVRAQQDLLIQRFQQLGLEVESFEVLVNSGSTGERFEGRQEPEPGQGVRLGPAQPSPARTPSLPSPGTGRGLDLFV